MELYANIIGVIAVVLYVLSYQQKKRMDIIITNGISRAFYILQYLLLGAFSGAVLDVLGIIISFLAAKKEDLAKRKLLPAVIVLMNVLILTAGILSYQNVFSVFSILGVAFHTNAFWLKDEKKIRIVSLLGCPCWMIYNFTSHAYGSALGDFITLFSIGTAMVRYDIMKKEKV